MTDKDKTVGGRMIPDDPGMDCTDGAHPAWWRGEEYGANAIIREVGEILDGAYDASGVASEPWEGLRRRLLALVDAHSRGIREGLERDGEGGEARVQRLEEALREAVEAIEGVYDPEEHEPKVRCERGCWQCRKMAGALTIARAALAAPDTAGGGRTEAERVGE